MHHSPASGSDDISRDNLSVFVEEDGVQPIPVDRGPILRSPLFYATYAPVVVQVYTLLSPDDALKAREWRWATHPGARLPEAVGVELLALQGAIGGAAVLQWLFPPPYTRDTGIWLMAIPVPLWYLTVLENLIYSVHWNQPGPYFIVYLLFRALLVSCWSPPAASVYLRTSRELMSERDQEVFSRQSR
ncbi:hypothetical protein FA95DRAFT_595616 [Auriscalpium vulgare]|uniref:Uncharacterized protein n=1 Tax=Auriscalpium vulgare TaxID=40419 RepID=A0ACB8S2V8_9AGAM|nr:hypothetical protein FA95DRAFT_595616 [Auriscalpium vulgare]